MKNILLALLIALFACTTFAADGDPKDARELGKAVHEVKRKSRVERAVLYRKYKARKLEGRATELRTLNAQAEKSK
jgi:hypothetical protein